MKTANGRIDCSCGDPAVHTIAERETADGVRIHVDSAGDVYVRDDQGLAGSYAERAGLVQRGGIPVFNRLIAKGLCPDARRYFVENVALYELSELRTLVCLSRTRGLRV